MIGIETGNSLCHCEKHKRRSNPSSRLHEIATLDRVAVWRPSARNDRKGGND